MDIEEPDQFQPFVAGSVALVNSDENVFVELLIAAELFLEHFRQEIFSPFCAVYPGLIEPVFETTDGLGKHGFGLLDVGLRKRTELGLGFFAQGWQIFGRRDGRGDIGGERVTRGRD